MAVSTLPAVHERLTFQVLTSTELGISDRPGGRNDDAQAS